VFYRQSGTDPGQPISGKVGLFGLDIAGEVFFFLLELLAEL